MAKIPLTIIGDPAGFARPVERKPEVGNNVPPVRDQNAGREIDDTSIPSTGGYDAIDPATFSGGSESGGSDRPRRRGRPLGSTNKPREAQTQTNISLANIENLLFSTHLMLAAWVNVPKLAISPEESKELADALGEVAKMYAVQIDPKKLCWMNFAAVAGKIYGTRAVSIYLDQKNAHRVQRPQVVPPQHQPSMQSQPEHHTEKVVSMPNPKQPRPDVNIPVNPARTSVEGGFAFGSVTLPPFATGPDATTFKKAKGTIGPDGQLKYDAQTSPSELWNDSPIPD